MTYGYASGVDGINADRWPVVIDVRMAAGLPAIEHGRECAAGSCQWSGISECRCKKDVSTRNTFSWSSPPA
ncbi:MAG: hypothetical protein QOE52_302 [Mycobacterium sp.]|jgi:hypothetical protein|nr:hypothetical protein [Mycobacterium sp.]MDT5341118.1 hypothetical protein [Mycobacterium sp.]MDT5353083.1 hypothetical protein [Mycobacterium sp.]MDT5371150.1 hypothetical protein [Mycobacterium sp.]